MLVWKCAWNCQHAPSPTCKWAATCAVSWTHYHVHTCTWQCTGASLQARSSSHLEHDHAPDYGKPKVPHRKLAPNSCQYRDNILWLSLISFNCFGGLLAFQWMIKIITIILFSVYVLRMLGPVERTTWQTAISLCTCDSGILGHAWKRHWADNHVSLRRLKGYSASKCFECAITYVLVVGSLILSCYSFLLLLGFPFFACNGHSTSFFAAHVWRLCQAKSLVLHHSTWLRICLQLCPAKRVVHHVAKSVSPALSS